MTVAVYAGPLQRDGDFFNVVRPLLLCAGKQPLLVELKLSDVRLVCNGDADAGAVNHRRRFALSETPQRSVFVNLFFKGQLSFCGNVDDEYAFGVEQIILRRLNLFQIILHGSLRRNRNIREINVSGCGLLTVGIIISADMLRTSGV